MIEIDYRCAWQWNWPTLNIVLNVSQQANSIFQANRQLEQRSHECGGQLFVNIDKNGEFWLFATPPHRLDKSGTTWLELDAIRCKAEIMEANAAELRLVGYWHTHPQRIPALSSRDISSLVAFSDRNKGMLQNPVAIIVGQSPEGDGIRAWSHRTQKCQILAIREPQVLAEKINKPDCKNTKKSE